MRKNIKLISSYVNGNTVVSIYEDGTKVRTGFGESVFPESMDVKITDYCDAGCKWCHEDSTTKGKHGDLESVVNIYKQMPKGVEIAIGGGNPLSHPQFDEFVRELSSFGVICNVTVNEFHWTNETVSRLEKLISDGAIKGVGYSYTKKPLDWDYEHACTHLIAGINHYDELDEIVKNNSKKVLLLGYKDFRRGSHYKSKHDETVMENISIWYRFLFTAARKAHLSFDNLAISQLNPKRLFVNASDYDKFFMGDDGTRTMYMDAVNQEYAYSSTGVFRNKFDKDTNVYQMFDSVKRLKA
jgi:organic radical activating enzyme